MKISPWTLPTCWPFNQSFSEKVLVLSSIVSWFTTFVFIPSVLKNLVMLIWHSDTSTSSRFSLSELFDLFSFARSLF